MLIAAEGGQGNIWPTIGMFALLFGLMYLLFIRPQSKRRKEAQQMQQTLGAGDKVITIGGLHGTVSAADDKTITIEPSPGVHLTFERQAVARVTEQTSTPAAADAGKAAGELPSPIQETKRSV